MFESSWTVGSMLGDPATSANVIKAFTLGWIATQQNWTKYIDHECFSMLHFVN